jgi:trans-aconitate 2-methyltransferase
VARDAWNPAQYERFHDERSRPFFDLLGLVRPGPAMRVVDLGCGTGKLTETLHRTLGARETLGIDVSDAMLAEARARATDGLSFERGDIADFAPGPVLDVVFSNAALHWLPDHPRLLARLVAALREGGQLAVQVPANGDHPSHVVAAEVAAESPFREALGGRTAGQPGVLAPEAYAALLDGLGCAEQHVRLQVYAHHLAGREEVAEWTKGTLLTAWERRLPPDLYREFVARYRERLLPRLVDTRPYLFLFKRILMWGRR